MIKFEAKSLDAPRLPSLFKQRGPKQFNYRPWFYDADKEERERRNRLIRSEKKGVGSDSEHRMDFRSSLHDKWRESHSGARQRSRSNLRLIVIIGLLFLIAYYLLK